jgi:hypothetical protein
MADAHTDKGDHHAGEEAPVEPATGQGTPAPGALASTPGWRGFRHLWAVVEITCFLGYVLVFFFPAGLLAWPGHPAAEWRAEYYFIRYLTGKHSPVLIACFLAGGLGLVFFVPAWPPAGSRDRRGWRLVVSLSAFLFLVGTLVLTIHYSRATE